MALIAVALYYFGAIILIAIVLPFVFAWLMLRLLPSALVTGVAVRVISFVLTQRLAGPVPSVPVRDIRLRDSNGQEHLVRLKGQLSAGSVAVGDDIVVEGWRRHGMLLFRRGYNRRVQAAIKVKRP